MSDEKLGVHFNFDVIDNHKSVYSEQDGDGGDYHEMHDQHPPVSVVNENYDPESTVRTPAIYNYSNNNNDDVALPPAQLNVSCQNDENPDNGGCEYNQITEHPINNLQEDGGKNPKQIETDGFEDNLNAKTPFDTFSIASTILTADGIADPVSFRLNCLIVFLGDMARGIFFPTMWNLVQTLGGDQVLLGYVVASFSFGRMLVLPLFGSWSIKYGYKWTLQISTFILFIGTLLFAQTLNVGKPWFLIFANIVVGIGSGTLGVTMAYASEVTPKRKRTGYLSWVTAVQYAGTTATPFIGSLFVVLFAKEEGDVNRGFPEINEFTAPALFMTFMSGMALYLVTKYFENRQRAMSPIKRPLSSRQRANEEVANSPTCFGYLSVRMLCLLGCMFMNAFTKGPMSCFETLGIEFAESRFDMYRAQAGSIVATMGFLGAFFLMVMGFLSQRFDDTQLTSAGIFLFVIGIIMNATLDQNEMNAHWKYVLSMFFCYSIGYPICHTALVGLFSKLVGRRPQGVLQGWFSASGSIARISFPIIAGYIVRNRDIETLFTVLATVLTFSMIFLIAFRRVLTLLSS